MISGVALAILTLPSPWGRTQDEITLEVNFVSGENSLDFGRLRNLETDGTPTTDTATRQVRLVIQPVVGNQQPYVVSQILDTAPTNEQGTSVSPNSIVYRVQEEEGSGTVRIPEQTPLGIGEQEIYRSGATGGNAQLLITYDLVASPDQEAGSYNENMVYRVSAI